MGEVKLHPELDTSNILSVQEFFKFKGLDVHKLWQPVCS